MTTRQRSRPAPEQLRLLATFPALIWRSRAEDGLCVWFNDLWLEFTGRTMDEEWGNGWAEGVHPDDVDGCIEIYTSAFARREPFSMEYRLRRHDGRYRWILDLGRPVIDPDSTFNGYLGACYDVDDRRRMIEELQQSQTVTTLFLQTIYHDLRSPLATMASLVATLQDPRVEHGQRDVLLSALGRSLDRAKSVIDDVRLLEQSESGTLTPRRADVDVTELLVTLVDRVGRSTHVIDVVDEIEHADIDPVIVYRALENLLNNAMDHTPAGTPIHLRAEAEDGHLRFAVADEGPGIPDDVLAHALDPRPSRGGPTSGGYGLGLSLADRYITAHGGRLDIRSSEGDGTTMTLILS